ncbi:hypothetical protein AcV5_000002 [Taiwanofungus camphoratus]|nr:hypothetical protein AcV5_000002 [Antrodia cinnamomea]
MECHNCELKQRQFYCENCLKQHLLSLRLQINHVAADRDAHINSAQRALNSVVDSARVRRADLKGTEERTQELWETINEVRQVNEKTREQLRTLRNKLSARRRTLAIASSTFHYPSSGVYPSSTPPIPASASPPYASTPTPPGGFPSPHVHSTSSQSVRPTAHRRDSSCFLSSHSPTPTATPPKNIPRPPMSGSRTTNSFPSPPSVQPGRAPSTPPSTSPYISRGAVTTSASPQSFSHARAGPSATSPHAQSDRRVDPLTRQIDEASYQLVTLSDTITRARSGLVQELVEVFSVVEVGGRPPLGGKAGSKGEWTIGGLVLPVPGDMRRYPPDHINAVITHIIHFLTLLAFYLGIKFPFEIVWSRSTNPPASASASSGTIKGNGLLGVGTPWIGSIRSGESGGWVRWSVKRPLHVSSSSTPSNASTISTSTSPRSPHSSHVRSGSTPLTSPLTSGDPAEPNASSFALADSQLDETSSTSASLPGNSFTTALAMLLYDVCYLAHTQAVEVPLAQAGEVLGNLWAVCCSPELGRRSHATHPLLPAPTPPNFPLDFSQLLQATSANPTRPRARGTSGKEVRYHERLIEEDEDGWDLVDAGAE